MAAAKKKQPAKKRTTSPAKPKKAVAAPPPAPKASQKLPSIWQLSLQTLRFLRANKKLFIGIAAVYVVLNVIFVTGLALDTSVTSVRDQLGNRFAGSLAVYSQLFTGSGNSASNAGVYQFALLVIASLAIIWALRQRFANNQVRARDAFYSGMGPLIPFLLVLLVLILMLIPMLIGVSLYEYVTISGIAAQSAELIFWGLLALALTLLSAFFVAGSLFGLYIVTLPDMTPLRALKLSRQLVRARRWVIIRKVLFLPLALVLLSILIVVPVVLVAPGYSQFSVAIIGPIMLIIGHTYLYGLYREVTND